MEDRIIKQIKTSCPFPLLVYKTTIMYNEVRKASGIAFILLELIEKSVGSDEMISDVLLKFRIPSDLHYIFGKELAGLIKTDIIQSVYSASHFTNPRHFGQIKVDDVSLTEKGKKMFREGAIPTGEEKPKIKDIFFSPVTRRFDIAVSQPYSDIATTGLGANFVDTIDVDISGMGDYINTNPTKIGIKAEERIVSYKTGEPQCKATRQDGNLTITVGSDGVEFKFASSDENAFFNKYYSSKIMKDIILLKSKYKFYDKEKSPTYVPTVNLEDLNAVNLYIPDELTKLAAETCKIFLGRNTFGYNGASGAIKIDEHLSAQLLSEIDGNAEFALLDNSGCKYYRALNLAMHCKQFGDTFEMPFLVEGMASSAQFDNIVKRILEFYKSKPIDGESGKVVTYAVEFLRDTSLFEVYAKAKLSEAKSTDEKISVLLKLNEVFGKSPEWGKSFVTFAQALFAESVKEIKLDNMIYKNTVLQPLRRAMRISDVDYIDRFAENVKAQESPELVYQALEAVGFSTNEILGVVNVVPLYMRAVLDNERFSTDNELATKYRTLQLNIWKLNDMLGIVDSANYTIKDDYNIDEFFNAYSTVISTNRSVEKYSQYAPQEYNEMKRFVKIYEPIHELLSVEKTAAAHPEKITEKYIDEQISRGKQRESICDLIVKLQFDLRKILKADSSVPANELIDEAKKQGYIDRKKADSLHQLRICRNGFQHAARKQIQYDAERIKEWKNIVFSLIGDEK